MGDATLAQNSISCLLEASMCDGFEVGVITVFLNEAVAGREFLDLFFPLHKIFLMKEDMVGME